VPGSAGRPDGVSTIRKWAKNFRLGVPHLPRWARAWTSVRSDVSSPLEYHDRGQASGSREVEVPFDLGFLRCLNDPVQALYFRRFIIQRHKPNRKLPPLVFVVHRPWLW